MPAQLGRNTYSVSANCPVCKTITSFDQKDVMILNQPEEFQGDTYTRILYVFGKCARCGRGGLAGIRDKGNVQTAVLESFYPMSVDSFPLPNAVPEDIEAEFREAEKCFAFGAKRAASALFRSALEKTLKANGYVKGNDSSLTVTCPPVPSNIVTEFKLDSIRRFAFI